jgi:signal transduction histidine kinase
VSGVAIVTLALGVVALCAALLNGWVYVLRRSERRHLWLAVAAIGVAMCCVPTAWIYSSTSAGEAIAQRRLLMVGLLVHIVGFVRFSEGLLGVNLARFQQVAIAALGFLAVASFVPGLTFSGRAVVRPLFGGSYVDAEVTAFGAATLLVFVGSSVYLFVLFRRHAHRIDDSLRGIPAAAGLWLACSLADLASGAGLIELPALFPLGQLGFVVAFTGLLLQRFVDAMAETEARALLLERRVEKRAQMLREKELQLANGERLAAAGTLAAGLAHEINNPIAFVLANLNHLQALRKEQDSETALRKEPDSETEIEEVLTETQEGIQRLRAIVDELLRLARTGDRVSEPVQLARVVESVLPIVRHEARGKVRIETSLAYAPLVNGDPGRLGQVVLNLIQNAIHALSAGERGGMVRVSVAAVTGGVELLVEDDGPGIPDHVLPRIFEPFFTTKRNGEGTGLGLAVTGEIVTRHGGTIDVETSPSGTLFRVTLPAAA